MQAINAYTQIYPDFDCQEILKKIERCGRVCYKSEGRIEEGSAEKFVAGIIKRGHEAVLEHGSFILEVPFEAYQGIQKLINRFEEVNDFVSYLRFSCDSRPIISGNVRAWRNFFKQFTDSYAPLPGVVKGIVKNNPILFPEYQNVKFMGGIFEGNSKLLKVSDLVTTKEKLTHWDVTVKFIIDRGVSHEVVRHRPSSYCQESTRYCNYSKEDFGKEVTTIIPSFLVYKSETWNVWKEAMKACEDAYFKLLDLGLLPQEARTVLPNSLKTELVMTANLSEWWKFFDLRTANAAHPQMREVSRPLLDELKELIPGIFNDITY